MGVLTGQDFRDKLQIMLGNRGFPNSQLDYWINLGLQKLTGEYEFSVLLNEVNGTVTKDTDTITLAAPATNLAGIISVRNVTDDLRVTKIDWEKYTALDTDDRGPVRHWLRFAENLRVWPSPQVDTTLKLTYQMYHPALTPTTPTKLIAAYDRPIILYSAYHALTDLEEPNRATYFLQTGDQAISRVVEQEAVEARGTPEPVQAIDSFEELRDGRTW